MKEVLQVAYLRHLQDFYLVESVKDGIITPMIFGRKMIPPMIADIIAAIRTAPAAASLAFFARGLRSFVTRSTTASTAVFTHSRPITIPVV